MFDGFTDVLVLVFVFVCRRVWHRSVRCVGVCFHDLHSSSWIYIDRSWCANVCVHHLPVRRSTVPSRWVNVSTHTLKRMYVCVLVFTSFSVHTQYTRMYVLCCCCCCSTYIVHRMNGMEWNVNTNTCSNWGEWSFNTIIMILWSVYVGVPCRYSVKRFASCTRSEKQNKT